MNALPEMTGEMLAKYWALALPAPDDMPFSKSVIVTSEDMLALVALARRGLAAARAEEELRGMVAATKEAERE